MLKGTDTATYCPHQGDCSYYTIVTPGGDLADAAWTYSAPYPAVAEIAGHVAFYPDRVQISLAD
jgi:uncharacterized protein (DUF427 family)